MAELRTIPIAEIDEPPLPMRQTMNDAGLNELADSIREVGLVQPITVIADNGRFRIVAGHRRFLAAQKIGSQEIACIVRQAGDVSELATMVAENSCREDVNAAEEAVWYAQLVEQNNYTEAQLMQLTKRSADYIGDRFRLLRGDEQVFRAVYQKQITHSTARELNKCENEEMRRYFLDAAVRGGQASRTVRNWIDEWRARQVPQQAAPAPVEAPAPEAQPNPYKMVCASCGGDKDPYAMTHIVIHRRCWDEIRRALREAANAE
jgi:ParB family transcriptional regulator, chromosome partitioning protein